MGEVSYERVDGQGMNQMELDRNDRLSAKKVNDAAARAIEGGRDVFHDDFLGHFSRGWGPAGSRAGALLPKPCAQRPVVPPELRDASIPREAAWATRHRCSDLVLARTATKKHQPNL